MDNNCKKLPKKRIILLIGAAALLVINIVFYSLGWFTFSSNSSTNGMGMLSDDCPFEIRTNGIIVDYAGLPEDKSKYVTDVENIFNYFNDSYGTDYITDVDDSPRTDTTSAGNTSIQWLMDENSFFDDNTDATGKRFRPGTSGKLTFWVVTKEPKQLTIHCDMKLIAFNGEMTEISPERGAADEKAAFDYIKGHILLFKQHTGSTYSGLIPFKLGNSDTNSDTGFDIQVDTTDTEDENVSSETYNEGKDDEYTLYLQKKTIYWVWPNTLGQLLFTSGSPNNGTDTPLLSDADERTKIKGLAKGDETAQKNYFKDIAEYTGSLNFDAVIEHLETNAKDGDYAVYYQRLNDAYNKADSAIGNNIRYVVFQMDAY